MISQIIYDLYLKQEFEIIRVDVKDAGGRRITGET